jgi:hypothetical protein
MAAHDGWNKVPPMILAQESMEKLGTFITVLEEVAFDLLTEKLFLRKLNSRQLCTKRPVLGQ